MLLMGDRLRLERSVSVVQFTLDASQVGAKRSTMRTRVIFLNSRQDPPFSSLAARRWVAV